MDHEQNPEQDAKVVPLRGGKCPICGKPVVIEMRPFCSKRCADLDLGRWLGGEYRVPTNEAPTEGSIDGPDDEDGF